jgi:NTP pyrophosphatase (non-canonical NTP hydrolase)
VRELQQFVAETADRLGLHATPATVLLDLQARVGALAGEVVRATEHGRRPFRPSRDWEVLLGDLAFAVVTLADQTGVDTDRAVRVAADTMYRSAMSQQMSRQQAQPAADAWPFSG